MPRPSPAVCRRQRPTDATEPVVAAGDSDLPEIEWEMPTSWPANLDTIFGAAVVFAEDVAALSGNRFRITAGRAASWCPPLEVLQNVQSGAYPIGHTASYYYTGLAELTAFGTALPFGLNARQQNAWLYEGGGLELLQGMYADRFGVIQFPAGNTGCQMGGWFNKEIGSVADLSGLKMRIPGLGGRIMDRLGVAVQQIAGGEIYQALQTGAIDAAEWVGPYDDLNLGFPEVAKSLLLPRVVGAGTVARGADQQGGVRRAARALQAGHPSRRVQGQPDHARPLRQAQPGIAGRDRSARQRHDPAVSRRHHDRRP